LLQLKFGVLAEAVLVCAAVVAEFQVTRVRIQEEQFVWPQGV
jgi:hypothetical protein